MNREHVDRWLDAYVAAWKSYDREAIAALFADDASYRFHPYDQPTVGREAIVEAWLGEGDHDGAPTRDAEGTYDATYRAIAVDGEVAVTTGTSTYRGEPGGEVTNVYDNCFVIRFDSEGRCREFTEWFMERPNP